jgi:simple sugar transport system permease protein
VITTLMLNYIAKYLLLYLINGPMQDPYSDLSQTDLVPEGMRLTKIMGETYRLHTGVFLMLAVVVFMIFFWRTTLGYRIDLTGQGEKVATYAGIHVKRTVIMTMFLSGMLSGIAGWIETFGINYRLLDGIAGSAGDIATIVALLGALNVYGIIAAACFFSVLLCGGASMQRMTDVPYSVVDVIQGLIIIFVIAKYTALDKITRLFQPLRAKGGKRHAE